jgi:hypothetical protein
MLSVAETLGNLVFCTTNTFKPFGKVKIAGSLIFTTGAGPGLGALLLSTCAITAIGSAIKVYNNIFFMYKFLMDVFNQTFN